MTKIALVFRIVASAAASVSITACEEVAPACPEGPVAPLGGACHDEGQTCAYGYDVPSCGGRTVLCTNGTWLEKEHTDPAASCHPEAGATCSHAGQSYAEGAVVRTSPSVTCLCLAGGELGHCTGALSN